MTALRGLTIIVAGAGAIGSCAALRLAQAGARVTLHDPVAIGQNASGVAAGMLAPALESALEAGGGDHFPLLLAARDAWPSLADTAPGLVLHRCGSIWLGEEAAQDRREGLTRLGIDADLVSAAQARQLSPGLAAGGGLFLAQDWRLDPGGALAALHAAFARAGGRMSTALVDEAPGADLLVYAAGHPAPAALALAPELAVLRAIKGQIMKFEAGQAPCGGPILRSDSVYVAPSSLGPSAGATMEAGRADVVVEPSAVDGLREAAAALYPALATARGAGRAGVRSASPDGLPLLGPSVAPGVMLATGGRRNGWLLAPLMAQMLVARIAGEAGCPWASAMDPARFSAAG